MPALVRISTIREEFQFTDRGRPEPVMRVEFFVGEDGPFYHTFPRATFEPASARTELERFARQLSDLRRET